MDKKIIQKTNLKDPLTNNINIFTENQIMIIKYLIINNENNFTNVKQIHESTNIAIKTIKKIISKLKKINFINVKRCRMGKISGFTYNLNEEMCQKFSIPLDIKTSEVLPPKSKSYKSLNNEYIYYPNNINGNNWVIKANKLLEAKYQLSVQEQRIIACMISLLRKEDDDFIIYRFSVKEIADLIGIKIDGYYKELKLITKKLLDKTFEIEEQDKTIQVGWISSAVYHENEAYVDFKFDSELKPYLLMLKGAYTKYQLINIIKLSSIYSIRIYELLKQYENIGMRILKIDELHLFLGLKNKKYNKYSDLKRIIIRAQQEISKKTDLNFNFSEYKDGRKVISITFYIKKNKQATQVVEIGNVIQESQNVSSSSDFETLLKLILKQHRKKNSINNILNKYLKEYSIEYIKRNIEYTNNQVKDQTKYAVYLDRALKDDWGLNFYEEKKQREKNRKLRIDKAQKEIQDKKQEIIKKEALINERKLIDKAIKNLPKNEQNMIENEANLRVIDKFGNKNIFGFNTHFKFACHDIYKEKFGMN